jgi:uncharacterized protein YndB with AHSA1/START domain
MTELLSQSTFQIERTYPQPIERVFLAWKDPAKKQRWYAEGEGFELQSYELDFRVGGFERTHFRPVGGPPMTLDALFYDIVENERVVFAYGMTIGGAPLSASLGTMELFSTPRGTRLVYTEHTAFLNGSDNSVGRREGTEQALVALGRELDEHA